MSSVVTPPPAPRPPAYLTHVKRFTVDEYHRMIGTVLPEGPGYELLEGQVVRKMPQDPPHATSTTRVRKRVEPLLPAGVTGRSQLPVTIGDSEPEPDFAVARGTDDDYTGRHPAPADVLLVVEVADSSRLSDRRDKGRLYAAAGLPVYWVVNIPDRQVEVYTDPQPAADPPGYAARADFKPGDAVQLTLDGVAVGSVPVADLLP